MRSRISLGGSWRRWIGGRRGWGGWGPRGMRMGRGGMSSLRGGDVGFGGCVVGRVRPRVWLLIVEVLHDLVLRMSLLGDIRIGGSIWHEMIQPRYMASTLHHSTSSHSPGPGTLHAWKPGGQVHPLRSPLTFSPSHRRESAQLAERQWRQLKCQPQKSVMWYLAKHSIARTIIHHCISSDPAFQPLIRLNSSWLGA